MLNLLDDHNDLDVDSKLQMYGGRFNSGAWLCEKSSQAGLLD